MCGRYAFQSDTDEVRSHFGVRRPTPVLTPSAEVFPGTLIPVVGRRPGEPGTGIAAMRWGYAPRWAANAKRVVNAKAETAATKPYFRDSYRTRRCLVPATAFYEWKPTGRRKTKYRIGPAGGGLLAFAGLWDRHGGEYVVCVLTVPADAAVAPVHDRMPAIVRPGDYDRWLDPDADPASLAEVLAPAPAGSLELAEGADDRPAATPGLFG